MDGFIVRYFLIKLIRVFHRAVFYTGGTSRASILYNVSRLLGQGDLKVSCLPFHTVNFSKCQNLYVWMPADLDQFRCENSHGTIIGGKGLIKLGHMAADARPFLHQVNLKTGRGKIESGLNTADSASNYHYVSKIIAFKT